MRDAEKECSQGWLEATTTGGRALLTKSSRRSYLFASLSFPRALPLPFRLLYPCHRDLPPHPPSVDSNSAHPRTLSHVRVSARAFPRDLCNFLSLFSLFIYLIGSFKLRKFEGRRNTIKGSAVLLLIFLQIRLRRTEYVHAVYGKEMYSNYLFIAAILVLHTPESFEKE